MTNSRIPGLNLQGNLDKPKKNGSKNNGFIVPEVNPITTDLVQVARLAILVCLRSIESTIIDHGGLARGAHRISMDIHGYPGGSWEIQAILTAFNPPSPPFQAIEMWKMMF